MRKFLDGRIWEEMIYFVCRKLGRGELNFFGDQAGSFVTFVDAEAEESWCDAMRNVCLSFIGCCSCLYFGSSSSKHALLIPFPLHSF